MRSHHQRRIHLSLLPLPNHQIIYLPPRILPHHLLDTLHIPLIIPLPPALLPKHPLLNLLLREKRPPRYLHPVPLFLPLRMRQPAGDGLRATNVRGGR
ncbi:hypothetical protein GRF29_19g3249779 [Pseudopithomyces chartarum]|uniref:Uncharacterized protein n=1 Tax=Pseudopithomyces chartarum TaxID=1892770 RepID=A0AAN6RM28_9PLEO|nr:hypothetical protein GRF29_19g3249779 [Pseudopithomyces chartarum]